MSVPAQPPRVRLLGVDLTALSFLDHVDLVGKWALARESRVVCVANVHMLVEARRDADFAEVIARADVLTPDGMPLVWLMRRRGARGQERVAGMDLLPCLCRRAAQDNVSVFFLGSPPGTLAAIRGRLASELPKLVIAGMESPPFRRLTQAEDDAIVRRIAASGAGFVFVSLGCPKQERWMDAHRGSVRAVMVGLGAAFPVYAGLAQRAPRWMQRAGLEWLYRLGRGPRRLWKRYLVTNALFLWYLTAERLLGRAR